MPFTRIRSIAIVLAVAGASIAQSSMAQTNPFYRFDANLSPRWSSPENLNGAKGGGGKANNGAKGHPFDPIAPGASNTLLDIQGQGIIHRIWITVPDRSAAMLRSLKLEMFWDNEKKAAVSVPLGDFFGVGLGKTAVFENALFANPEGRSFNCFIPMPFKKAARIIVTNESGKPLSHFFFDVDYSLVKIWDDDYLYFHAYWHRDTATRVAEDFELLPSVRGRGRFLGVNIGINANPAYGKTWWGEGEVKMFLDGDQAYPTLAGTGTEDYIGTGWGQGIYTHQYTGCLVANDSLRQWCYYRYHIPDPIFFTTDCRVTLQQIGGGPKATVSALQEAGAPLSPITVDKDGKLMPLYEKGKTVRLKTANVPDTWVNYYRSDDVSATAYFYLDRPSSALPDLQPMAIRIHHLTK
jgi:hypothetical protein